VAGLSTSTAHRVALEKVSASRCIRERMGPLHGVPVELEQRPRLLEMAAAFTLSATADSLCSQRKERGGEMYRADAARSWRDSGLNNSKSSQLQTAVSTPAATILAIRRRAFFASVLVPPLHLSFVFLTVHVLLSQWIYPVCNA
jgi:hypothetical protein